MRAPKLIAKTLLSWALAVLAGIVVTSAAVNASAGPMGPVVNYESSINREVLRNLRNLPRYTVFDHLEFQVNGDEVTLQGQVVNSVNKHDAENAVKRIRGVERVVNNIQVLPASIFDDQIRRAEYRSIYSQPMLSRYAWGPVPQIHIIVKNGHVTLEGMVANEMDRNVAGIKANSVSGVFSVTNNLKVG